MAMKRNPCLQNAIYVSTSLACLKTVQWEIVVGVSTWR